MKLKHLLQSIKDNSEKRIPLETWLKTQPGSTKRGVAGGRFQLPKYVR